MSSNQLNLLTFISAEHLRRRLSWRKWLRTSGLAYVESYDAMLDLEWLQANSQTSLVNEKNEDSVKSLLDIRLLAQCMLVLDRSTSIEATAENRVKINLALLQFYQQYQNAADHEKFVLWYLYSLTTVTGQIDSLTKPYYATVPSWLFDVLQEFKATYFRLSFNVDAQVRTIDDASLWYFARTLFVQGKSGDANNSQKRYRIDLAVNESKRLLKYRSPGRYGDQLKIAGDGLLIETKHDFTPVTLDNLDSLSLDRNRNAAAMMRRRRDDEWSAAAKYTLVELETKMHRFYLKLSFLLNAPVMNSERQTHLMGSVNMNLVTLNTSKLAFDVMQKLPYTVLANMFMLPQFHDMQRQHQRQRRTKQKFSMADKAIELLTKPLKSVAYTLVSPFVKLNDDDDRDAQNSGNEATEAQKLLHTRLSEKQMLQQVSLSQLQAIDRFEWRVNWHKKQTRHGYWRLAPVANAVQLALRRGQQSELKECLNGLVTDNYEAVFWLNDERNQRENKTRQEPNLLSLIRHDSRRQLPSDTTDNQLHHDDEDLDEDVDLDSLENSGGSSDSLMQSMIDSYRQNRQQLHSQAYNRRKLMVKDWQPVTVLVTNAFVEQCEPCDGPLSAFYLLHEQHQPQLVSVFVRPDQDPAQTRVLDTHNDSVAELPGGDRDGCLRWVICALNISGVNNEQHERMLNELANPITLVVLLQKIRGVMPTLKFRVDPYMSMYAPRIVRVKSQPTPMEAAATSDIRSEQLQQQQQQQQQQANNQTSDKQLLNNIVNRDHQNDNLQLNRTNDNSNDNNSHGDNNNGNNNDDNNTDGDNDNANEYVFLKTKYEYLLNGKMHKTHSIINNSINNNNNSSSNNAIKYPSSVNDDNVDNGSEQSREEDKKQQQQQQQQQKEHLRYPRQRYRSQVKWPVGETLANICRAHSDGLVLVGRPLTCQYAPADSRLLWQTECGLIPWSLDRADHLSWKCFSVKSIDQLDQIKLSQIACLVQFSRTVGWYALIDRYEIAQFLHGLAITGPVSQQLQPNSMLCAGVAPAVRIIDDVLPIVVRKVAGKRVFALEDGTLFVSTRPIRFEKTYAWMNVRAGKLFEASTICPFEITHVNECFAQANILGSEIWFPKPLPYDHVPIRCYQNVPREIAPLVQWIDQHSRRMEK